MFPIWHRTTTHVSITIMLSLLFIVLFSFSPFCVKTNLSGISQFGVIHISLICLSNTHVTLCSNCLIRRANMCMPHYLLGVKYVNWYTYRIYVIMLCFILIYLININMWFAKVRLEHTLYLRGSSLWLCRC